MCAPAHTIGVCTLPGVSFTVPCAETLFDHTGNPMRVRNAMSRTPASMTKPAHAVRHQAGGEQVAEIAVLARAGGRHHQHVASLGLLDRDVDHPVVARATSQVSALPADA